ncbi:MAG: hypothetical protein Q8O00_11900 [Holophaga sp.]|nr:hypothetical protein [Holophaga sp.]
MHDHDHSPDHACCGPRATGLLACPRCRSLGKPVSRDTASRFISTEAMVTLGAGEIRFCPHPACPVAYYAPSGTAILKDQLSVRLGIKETEAPRPICHCFGHSMESLAAEWEAKGSVSAVIEVMGKVRAGECHCEELNPQGVCCLTELRRAVLSLQELPPMPEPEPQDACGSCSDTSGCASCG